MLDIKVTDNRTHDGRCAIELVENSVEKAEGSIVKDVITDIDYNTHKIFRQLAERGIKPVIKVRRKGVITSKRAVVRAIREGKKKRRKANGYGRRLHVESFFSSFKQWFGEYVSSMKFENIRKELTFKVMISF